MNRKKLKYGGASLLITVFFLTAVILLNIFAAMLTDRFFLKADLTDTGIFTLDDRAAELLRGMGETVDVIVLAEESAWLANPTLTHVVDIFKSYSAAAGGRLRVQYADPDLNSFDGPRYGNSLSALKDAHPELEDMARNDILLVSQRRAAMFSVTDLFLQSADQSGRPVITGVRADQELVSALTYVLSEKVARAVFIEGHQENPTEMLRELFEWSGYLCSTVNLALQNIPEDTVFLISSAPKTDFLSEEIVKLEEYLSSGGNMLLFYDFHTSSLPLLDTFLAQWGIAVESKLLFDEEFTYSAQLNLIGAKVSAGPFPSSPSAEVITSALSPAVGVPRASPLRSLWAENMFGRFELFPLLQTMSNSSYAKNVGEGGIATWEREPGDDSGPFTIAYISRQMTFGANNEHVHSHLIVAGGADMVDDTFLSFYGGNFYNLALIADLANDLNPFGESVFIPSKLFHDSFMPVSAGAARSILITMVIILPLAIMAAGILVWRKRRHK
jgi:ABC-2 type transport system permease protein